MRAARLDVSRANGSGSGGGVSRIVDRHDLDAIGRQRRPASPAPRRSSARRPCPPRRGRRRCTCRRATADRSRRRRTARRRCPACPAAAPPRPRRASPSRRSISAFSTPSPPVPYSFAFAGSFDSGSPPWMIPMPDHAMKHRPVVGALARQLDEVADVVRREIRPQVDDERPGGRVNDRLLVRHLRRR